MGQIQMNWHSIMIRRDSGLCAKLSCLDLIVHLHGSITAGLRINGCEEQLGLEHRLGDEVALTLIRVALRRKPVEVHASLDLELARSVLPLGHEEASAWSGWSAHKAGLMALRGFGWRLDRRNELQLVRKLDFNAFIVQRSLNRDVDVSIDETLSKRVVQADRHHPGVVHCLLDTALMGHAHCLDGKGQNWGVVVRCRASGKDEATSSHCLSEQLMKHNDCNYFSGLCQGVWSQVNTVLYN